MKILLMIFGLFLGPFAGFCQLQIHDESIVNQQERMVFKSWDADKFTPTSGFLGLNPMYWLTWGLHPNYPDTDLRPLSPVGPQTMRLGLLAAMRASEDAYKRHSDTLSTTALSSFAGYSAALAQADPLWQIYYRSALSPLSKSLDGSELSGLGAPQLSYLTRTGVVDWYRNAHAALKERLEISQRSPMERGSRIIFYHRLLAEMRALRSSWEEKKRSAKKYLWISSQLGQIKAKQDRITSENKGNSDIEIANRVLKNSKL